MMIMEPNMMTLIKDADDDDDGNIIKSRKDTSLPHSIPQATAPI